MPQVTAASQIGSPGNDGNHPDLASLIIQSINVVLQDNASQDQQPVLWDRQQLTVLQRRTIGGHRFPTPQGDKIVALSTQFGILERDFGGDESDKRLLLFQAIADPTDSLGGAWKPIQWRTRSVSASPLKPFLGLGFTLPSFAAMGFLVTHPDIVKVRIELADGRVAEDHVARDSLALLLPHESDAAWSRNAMIRFFDPTDREIIAGEQPLAPAG